MLTCGAGDALVILLDHASRDVVFAAAGVLVNLSADAKCSGCMISSPSQSMNACNKLVHVLRRAGLRDLDMSTVAAKALFNVLSSVKQKPGAVESILGTQLGLLHQSLDELLDAAGEDSAEFSTVSSALYSVVDDVLCRQDSIYEDLPYDMEEPRLAKK